MAAAGALVLLIAAAIVHLQTSALARAKERALQNNLFTLRTAIDEYTFDRKTAPRALQDLVDRGYLLRIPIDPLTGSDRTWRIVPEDPGPTIDDRIQRSR
jgi:general secretion pathway protein G